MLNYQRVIILLLGYCTQCWPILIRKMTSLMQIKRHIMTSCDLSKNRPCSIAVFNRPKGSKRCNIVHSLRTGKLPSLIDKSSCLSSMNVHCFIAMLNNQRVIQLGMVDRWVRLIPQKWCLQSGESSSCHHGQLDYDDFNIKKSAHPKKHHFLSNLYFSGILGYSYQH